MKHKWTLNRSQLLWVGLYSAVLPASIFAAPFLGDWALLTGVFISLPLTPFGFLAFWGSVTVGGELFGFLFTWLFNFFVAWLLLAQYIGYKRKRGIDTSTLSHIARSIVAAIVFIMLATVVFYALSP